MVVNPVIVELNYSSHINVTVTVLGWPFSPGCPISIMVTDLIYCLRSVYMLLFFFSPFSPVLYVASAFFACCVMRDFTWDALVPEFVQTEGYGDISYAAAPGTILLDYG